MDSSSRVPVIRRTWELVVIVFSCLALNDYAAGGHWLPGPLLGIGDSQARLSGSQARAEPGHKVELSRDDRWRDPVRPRLLMWDEKDRYRSCPGLVPFKVVVPPSQVRWDCIWYGVFGSLAVCHWRKLGRIQICWAVTGGPRYPGYRTPTIHITSMYIFC
jgi:hypothetical protein